MKIFADYDFYITEYGGGMSESNFTNCILHASQEIRRTTYNRADNSDIDELKYCACELADVYNTASQVSISDTSDSARKSSENIDGYSVSYISQAASGETTEELVERKAGPVMRKWLAGTGLMYAGGDCYASN